MHLFQVEVLLPVAAIRNLGRTCPFWRCRNRYQILDAALRTPSSNLTEIIERTQMRRRDAPGYAVLGGLVLIPGILALVLPAADDSRTSNVAAGVVMAGAGLALLALSAALELIPTRNEVIWRR